jgi:hypothetical protein
MPKRAQKNMINYSAATPGDQPVGPSCSQTPARQAVPPTRRKPYAEIVGWLSASFQELALEQADLDTLSLILFESMAAYKELDRAFGGPVRHQRIATVAGRHSAVLTSSRRLPVHHGRRRHPPAEQHHGSGPSNRHVARRDVDAAPLRKLCDAGRPRRTRRCLRAAGAAVPGSMSRSAWIFGGDPR